MASLGERPNKDNMEWDVKTMQEAIDSSKAKCVPSTHLLLL